MLNSSWNNNQPRYLKSPSPCRAQTPRFQGVTNPQAELLTWAESASLLSPRELLEGLEAMIKRDYLTALDRNKSWVEDEILEDGVVNVKKLKRRLELSRYTHEITEASIPYKAYEMALIEKLTAEAYLNKPGNTANELRTLLVSLDYYEPSEACVYALALKFTREANKNMAMMP